MTKIIKASKCPECTASVPQDQDQCGHCGTDLIHSECEKSSFKVMNMNRSTITRDNIKVYGDRNVIKGNNIIVVGHRNSINGDFVEIHGDRNVHTPGKYVMTMADWGDSEEPVSIESHPPELTPLSRIILLGIVAWALLMLAYKLLSH